MVVNTMEPKNEGSTWAPGAADRLVVQFPRELPTGLERPHFMQGDARRPTYLWSWTSAGDRAVEMGAQGMETGTEQPAESQQLTAVSSWTDGEWRVLFRRSLATPDSVADLQLPRATAVPIAFQAWDGDNGEAGKQAAVSTWYFLALEDATPATVYVAPIAAFLLTAVGLLYGQAGTLNLADLARAWPDRRTPGLDAALSMLFLTAFGIKAGLFPLFFWLPASYHTPPAAVGALLAGLLTKVGVYAMIRVFTLLFPDPNANVYRVLLVLSAVTMVAGLIGALAQRDFRRVLSFNLVGHIGFTTVGLALWTPAALGGSILYVLHHMLVISTLFLVSGLFLRQRRTTDLGALGGLYRSQPAVAGLVLIPLFSLAGIPPLSGFVAKVAVVAPMFGAGQYALAAVALGVSLLTMLSMARLWEESSWKPTAVASSSIAQPRLGGAIVAPTVFLVSLTIALTAWAGPVSSMTMRAAEQLLDRNTYVRAVLGEEVPRAAR